jgi:hypothetical protein
VHHPCRVGIAEAHRAAQPEPGVRIRGIHGHR